MNKIFFEDAQLYFQDFYIGTLSSDIEFHGSFGKAVIDNFTSKYYAQVHSNDMILRFALKEKSPQFQKLLKTSAPVKTDIKNLLSDFGTIKIITPQNCTVKIHEAFWTRYPIPEFQLKHNPENTILSLYFLWR